MEMVQLPRTHLTMDEEEKKSNNFCESFMLKPAKNTFSLFCYQWPYHLETKGIDSII